MTTEATEFQQDFLNRINRELVRDYVATIREIETLTARLDELARQEKATRPQVLSAIDASGGRYTCQVDRRPAVLTIAERESISAVADEETILDAAERCGVKISERSPRYVHHSTFRAAIMAGQLPEELAERKVTRLVEIH